MALSHRQGGFPIHAAKPSTRRAAFNGSAASDIITRANSPAAHPYSPVRGNRAPPLSGAMSLEAMAGSIDQRIAQHRQEIALLVDVIACVSAGGVRGRTKPEIVAALQSSLALHRE